MRPTGKGAVLATVVQKRPVDAPLVQFCTTREGSRGTRILL